MSTLLNYGFTTKPKAPKSKAVSEVQRDDRQSERSGPMKPLPAAPSQFMHTALPPIPPTTPISLPQLRRRSTKPRSRPSSGHASPQQHLPRQSDEAPRRPPPPTPPQGPITRQYASAGGSPIQLTATLFPQVKLPPVPLRQPSEGLKHSSSRIQNILEKKQVGRLALPADSRSPAKNNRRNSIGVTPVSAYGGHNNGVVALPFAPKFGAAASEQEMALTPIEMDLGALEVIASLPVAARPARKQSLGRPSLRKSVYHSGRRGPVMAVELPGGSLMTVITPEQSAWQRAPYLPGAIRLEPKTKPARSPMAILHPEQEKLLAEQAIIDDLASFVHSYGGTFCSGTTDLDRYWLKSNRSASHMPGGRSTMTPLSVTTSTAAQSKVLPRVTKRDSKTMSSSDQTEFESAQIRGMHDLPSPAKRDRVSQLPTDRSSPSPGLPPSATPSPPPGRHLFSSSTSQKSPGFLRPDSPFAGSSASAPKKGVQAKAKGSNAAAQKISLRGLIRSAASIV